MKRNMGGIDRGLRILAGAALLYFGLVDISLVDNQVIRYIMATFGVINIVTGLIGFCPMYILANLSTLSKTDS